MQIDQGALERLVVIARELDDRIHAVIFEGDESKYLAVPDLPDVGELEQYLNFATSEARKAPLYADEYDRIRQEAAERLAGTFSDPKELREELRMYRGWVDLGGDDASADIDQPRMEWDGQDFIWYTNLPLPEDVRPTEDPFEARAKEWSGVELPGEI